ncbi:MAG: hypothetical protein V7765_03390 [Oleispira sp.]
MILLYSIFACSVMLGGLVTAISIIRGGYTDSSGINAFQHLPEEHS